MAFSTTVNDENLARVYSDEKLFEPCQRELKPFWDEMQEAKDVTPRGAGLYFMIVGATGHAVGTPAEGGDWSDSRNQLGVQPFVTSAQIDSTVEVTEKFFNAAKGDGALGGDAGHNAIVTATRDLFSYAQRLLACGHGTGRLAIVESSTVANTAFTAKLNEGAWQLRQNQPIEFADTDTGGSVQATAIITSIDYLTRVVTTDTSLTLTANWGVYQRDTYGVGSKPNGIRSIVDDGDYATSIFGISRSAPNTFLNAVVMDNSGGIQDYSEELVADLLDQISMRQDMIPTVLRTNLGLIREHQRIVTADRTYPTSGNSVSSYPSGINQNALHFQYGDTKIPFKLDRDLPARELYALHMPSWRRHTLRKAGWVKPEGGGIFQLKPSTSTYAHAYIASMLMDINVSCRRLNAQGKLSMVRDRSLARDTA